MHFNFHGQSFDPPTLESAMSWREKFLLSLFAHLVLILLIVLVPQLPFMQEAAVRKAERIAELAELQAQALRQQRADESRPFVFIKPQVDLKAEADPRPDAPLSDQDRIAQSLLRTVDPENRLPVSEGNSLELVEAEEPRDGLLPEEPPGSEDADALYEPDSESRLVDASAGQVEATDVLEEKPGDPDNSNDLELSEVEGILGQAMQNLRQRVGRESLNNVNGDTGQYGPEIQFDSKGVEFGPWIRRFVAQVRRNWFLPYAALSEHGHVVLTFHVHRDGSLTDLNISQPSSVDSFNRSSFNALLSSNPTRPLPEEYPDDHVFFTVTFFYNEAPPYR